MVRHGTTGVYMDEVIYNVNCIGTDGKAEFGQMTWDELLSFIAILEPNSGYTSVWAVNPRTGAYALSLRITD